MSQPNGESPPLGPDGKTLAGPGTGTPTIPGYRILGRLGRGAVGAVYLAEEESLERRVALKLLAGASGQDRGARRRFGREARAMATVEHPHVVRVYAFGEVLDQAGMAIPFLVMEYVEGESLATRMSRKGALPVTECLRIARQTVEALAAAWRRSIVHRDVKPGNVLIDRHGEVRVCDFGLAKPVHLESSMTATGTSFGTPRYIPPEQALGKKIDFRSDIYSLGVMLWEMLAGRRPFDEENPHLLIGHHIRDPLPSLESAGLPPSIDRLVARMTEKDPERRFGDHAELLQAIEIARELTATVAGSTGEAGEVASAEKVASTGPSSDNEGSPDDAEPASESGFALLGGDIELPDLGSLTLRASVPAAVAAEPPAVATTAAPPPERRAPASYAGEAESLAALDSAATQGPTEAVISNHRSSDPDPSEPGAQLLSSDSDSGSTRPDSAVFRAAAVGSKSRKSPKKLWGLGNKKSASKRTDRDPGEADGTGDLDDLAELGTLSGLDSGPGEDAFVELLGAIEERRSRSREQRMKHERQRAGGRLLFDELKKEVIVPSLRRLMSELHQQGHPTRLQDLGKRGVRFEFLLDSTPVTRCHLEVEPDMSGRVVLRFLQNLSVVAEQICQPEAVTAELIGKKMAAFLRRGARRGTL